MKMKPSQFLSIIAAFSAASCLVPAWSDDAAENPANSQLAQTASQPATKSTSSHSLLNLPRAFAGFCSGAVVGTPICFARKFHQELKEEAHGLAGSIITDEDSGKFKYVLAPAYLFQLPFAGIFTLMMAPGYALKDAYTAEKPFTREQFSLGELDK